MLTSRLRLKETRNHARFASHVVRLSGVPAARYLADIQQRTTREQERDPAGTSHDLSVDRHSGDRRSDSATRLEERFPGALHPRTIAPERLRGVYAIYEPDTDSRDSGRPAESRAVDGRRCVCLHLAVRGDSAGAFGNQSSSRLGHHLAIHQVRCRQSSKTNLLRDSVLQNLAQFIADYKSVQPPNENAPKNP